MKPITDPMRVNDATYYGVAQTLQRQHHVLTRSQATGAGISEAAIDSRLRRGAWTVLFPRVYLTSGSADDVARLWAAALWAGPESIIAGRAAHFWNGILAQAPEIVTIYLPKRYTRRTQPGIRLVRADVKRVDTVWRHGLRVTTAERTGLDLARWDAGDDYLEVAIRRGDATAASIQQCLMRMGRLRGRVRAARAWAHIATSPWSPPERTVHRLLTEAGLCGWIANMRVATAIGDVFPDIAFPDVRLVVEIKGKRYHDEAVDRAAFERDHRREQALSDIGWFVIGFTARQIEQDPQAVLRSIIRKLEQLAVLFC